MRKVIVITLGVGLLVAWQLWGPSLLISSQNAAGRGWDGARPELTTLHTGQISKLLKAHRFAVSEADQGALVRCVVDESIKRLNETGCSYQYNKATTSEAEHTKAQDACLEAHGWMHAEEAIFVQCVKAHLPDDWALVGPAIRQGMTESLQASQYSAEEAGSVARCAEPRIVTLFKEAECHLINADAKRAVDLFNSPEVCITQRDLGARFMGIGAQCVAELEVKGAP